MDSCTDYEIAEHTRNNYRGRVLLRYEIVYGQLPQKLMGPSVIILMTIQGLHFLVLRPASYEAVTKATLTDFPVGSSSGLPDAKVVIRRFEQEVE